LKLTFSRLPFLMSRLVSEPFASFTCLPVMMLPTARSGAATDVPVSATSSATGCTLGSLSGRASVQIVARLAGVLCLALWLVGVAGVLDQLPASPYDNWLKLLLGLGLLALSALTSRQDLGDDLERDLGRRLAAEVEPDGPMY